MGDEYRRGGEARAALLRADQRYRRAHFLGVHVDPVHAPEPVAAEHHVTGRAVGHRMQPLADRAAGLEDVAKAIATAKPPEANAEKK